MEELRCGSITSTVYDELCNLSSIIPLGVFTYLRLEFMTVSKISKAMPQTISASNFADVMGVSKATLKKWEANSTFTR